MVRLTGEGLRSVGVLPIDPIQERFLYPAPRSTFTGRGSLHWVIPGPRLAAKASGGLGGTRPGEEVRDGPHSDNCCGGNRGGVAPTAAPLRPRAGARGTPAFILSLAALFGTPPWRGPRIAPSPRCAGPRAVRP